MATNKNKKTETAASQAAPTPESQTAQAAPETVTETSAEGKTAAAAPDPDNADKKVGAVKEEKKPKKEVSVLEKAGKAAIARHGFKEVFVTSDGLAFPLRSDAQHHASDLANKEIIKVTE